MHVYYDENLKVTMVVTMHMPDYDPACNIDPAQGRSGSVHHPDFISHHRIHLERTGSAVMVREKQDMPIMLERDSLALGDEARFRSVPTCAVIVVNGNAIGQMDDSGVFEFSPETEGVYDVRFVLDGHVDREFRLEVVSGN